MPIDGYFDTVFATAGDLNPVPDATQPSGTVSYEQGFPVLYSTPVSSGGYNVPRTSINQLFNDVTTAVQNWQQNTIAPFITSTMNGGTPYSYPQYAVVLHSGVAYQSLVGSNTDTPPSSKWGVFNINTIGIISSTQTVTGTSHTYAAADNRLLTLRGNSGTLMTDTLPGTSPGVMTQGWQAEIVNNDASALYYLSTGSGANLNGSSTGNIVLGPGQRCIVFSDGSNYWAQEMPTRFRLGANTNFYVATTGSDSNNGLASGTPWATLQHAVNYLQENVDLGGFTGTINVANGTYTAGVVISFPFTGGFVVLSGNTGSPTSCIISTTNATAIQAVNNGQIGIQGFELTTTTSGDCIDVSEGGVVTLLGAMNFGACAGTHINATFNSEIYLAANYTVSGSAVNHYVALYNGRIRSQSVTTITVSGTPAFSTAFANANGNATIQVNGITYSGPATGTRYTAILNGVISTGGGGASYFPGSIAGSTSTGGQYA